MSTSYQDIVRDALQLLNVITEIDTPSAEQGVHGLRVLNDMMAFWLDRGLDVEYVPSDDLTADVDVDRAALRAMKYGLAVELGQHYRGTLTPDVAAVADQSWDVLKRSRLVIEPLDMSHLTRGSGYGERYNIETDE